MVWYTVYSVLLRDKHRLSWTLDLASNDLRCNVGGATGGNTSTLESNAGDPFTFTLDTAVYHQGPVSLYMSKAPSTAAEYDGSGDWFKIGSLAAKNDSTWITHGQTGVSVQLRDWKRSVLTVH